MAEIGLNFILDGKQYAYRQWPAVPRAGDVVKLRDPLREKGLRYPARVLSVVWASWAGKLLECDVYIAWDDDIEIPKITPSEPPEGEG